MNPLEWRDAMRNDFHGRGCARNSSSREAVTLKWLRHALRVAEQGRAGDAVEIMRAIIADLGGGQI